ncbi:MAG TPA: hypothetical protein VFP58_01660 [Candidatus Eisenbacteria bacterium]|nr:hypothetical protein [Candidatus Eisenbacteria bacterium]
MRLAGYAIVALGLALSTGAQGSSKELQIVDATIEGTSVVLKVENTTDALVDGRCLGYFNNGNGTYPDEKSFEGIAPGVHEFTLEFPEGSVAPTAILDEPDPIGTAVPPGTIVLGTITDDIHPF